MTKDCEGCDCVICRFDMFINEMCEWFDEGGSERSEEFWPIGSLMALTATMKRARIEMNLELDRKELDDLMAERQQSGKATH